MEDGKKYTMKHPEIKNTIFGIKNKIPWIDIYYTRKD